MVVSNEEVDVNPGELHGEKVICSSASVLGNGLNEEIRDIVFMQLGSFNPATTQKIASDLDKINQPFIADGNQYLLIGFGRWGTSDAWAGIPVTWGQISAAKVIVEAPLEGMNSELSQGSHFFHNVTSFRVFYFSVPYSGEFLINWEWLNSQEEISSTEHVKHVRLSRPLTIKVDGRSGKGVIIHNENT